MWGVVRDGEARDVRRAGSAATEDLFCYFVQQHEELTLSGMGEIDRG